MKISNSQLRANQANALRSTGPQSEQGKAAVRLNSLQHGLTATQLVLSGESAEEYNDLRAQMHQDYAPANPIEVRLVEQIAQSYWRLQRAMRIESAFMDNRAKALTEENPGLTLDEVLALLITDKAESAKMRLMMRYFTSIERAYNKAVGELTRIQRERRKQQELDESIAMLSNGFVSQSASSVVETAATEPVTASVSDSVHAATGA